MKKKHIIIILIILVSIVIVITCLGLRGCADTKEGVQSGLEEQEEEDNQDDTDTPTNSAISSDTVTEEEFENGSQNSVSGSGEQSEVDKDTNTDSEQNNVGEVTSKETYTITYVLNYSNATIETATQEVKANEAFTLLIPTVPKGDDYSFVKWVITGTNTEVTNGIFSFNSDISLTAVWEDTYSKNY